MASSVNSFRAFKLKLPKKEGDQDRVDDVRKTPTKRRPVSPIRITSGYNDGVSGRESRTSFDAKTKQFDIKCERDEFYTVSPMSAYLPRIFTHTATGKLDVPWQDRFAGFLPGPQLVANDPLSRLRLSNSIYMAQGGQDLPFLPNLIYQSLRTRPEYHEASSDIPPQDVSPPYSPKREKLHESSSLDSSPVASDTESSHKCSSSPGSSDSGYTGSTDTSSLMNESDIDPKVPDAEKREGCFKCNFCKRTFSYLCHLKVHERVHTGEKPYSCKYCSQQFSQLGSLTVHMRIHTGAKPYQCGECSKRFRHVNSLRRHQRQVHNMTSTQIAASIDKCKEECGQTKHTDHPTQQQNHAHQNKRKREQISGESNLASHAYYRAQNAANNYILDTRNVPFQSSVQCKKEGLESHSAVTYKSRFIRELENREREKTKLQNDRGVRVTASRISEKNGSKATSKTWRPFLVDEDKKTVSYPSYDPISPAVVHKTDESKFVVNQPWVAGFSHPEYVTKPGLASNNFKSLQVRNYRQRKLDMSESAFWKKFNCNNMQAVQQNMNPSCMWLSPLSLRSSPAARINTNENKPMERESPERCLQRNLKTDSRSPCEDNVKMEKEYNSTDEGFSSSSSAGARSPGSPNLCQLSGNVDITPTKKMQTTQETVHVV